MFFGCDTLSEVSKPVACPNCDGQLELIQKQTSRVRHYYKCKSCGLGRIDYYPSERTPDTMTGC